MIVVLNPTRAESVFDAGGNQRVAGTEDISVPADWAGENVEVFLGFITADGKEVANSIYLGSQDYCLSVGNWFSFVRAALKKGGFFILQLSNSEILVYL